VADAIFQVLSDFFARYGYGVAFFGVMLSATTIAGAGFLFGSSWERVVRFAKEFEELTVGLILVGTVAWLIFYQRRRGKKG